MTNKVKLLYFAPLLLLYFQTSNSFPNLKDVLNLRRGFETINNNLDKMRYLNINKNHKATAEKKIIMPSRRQRKKNKEKDLLSSHHNESSVSSEEIFWKNNWIDYWDQKKFEAINNTAYIGDSVDMVAARPWGVSCGDPNQHDEPWGSCTLPLECDAEYRIYRGDYFCGRSQFVCCAVLFTNYDLYQAFDQSFEDSLSTDTEERNKRKRSSSERRRKKNKQRYRERLKERMRRKRRIRRNIRKIVSQIRSLLQKLYRNKTLERKKKTRWMKRYVKLLKDQYKADRLSIKDIHSIESKKVDKQVVKTLEQIKEMNKKFISNNTFRDMVLQTPGAGLLTESDEDESTLIFTKPGRKNRRVNNKDLQYDLDDIDT